MPLDHPFAQTQGAANAICLGARSAGSLLLAGEGAGGEATASAVIADIVDALRATGSASVAPARHTGLDAPGEISTLFSRFAQTRELPGYAIWDEVEEVA